MITLIAIVGFLTTTLSILVKLVGFPDQIRKNFQRKSTEGISTAFYILSFTVYLLWTLYGFLQHDWVVMLGQGLGIITTGAIVYQIYLYKEKK